MFKSIRWSLFVWNAVLLVAVVVGFAALLYFKLEEATRNRVDAELVGAGRMLTGALEKKLPAEKAKKKVDEKAKHKAGKEVEENLTRQGYSLPPHYLHPFKGKKEDRMYFAIWKGKDEVLVASDPIGEIVLPEEHIKGPPHKHEIRVRGELREAILSGPQGTHILVGKSIHKEQLELQNLLGILLTTAGIVLGVGLVGGWFLAQRALRPIRKITRAAEAISAANLAQRIDVAETESELGQLAGVLNATFARLEAAFEQQARFTADASHELRTPVSVILSQTEFALRKERSAPDYKDAVAASHRAAVRMKSLVDGLLTLARADAGQITLNKQDIDLSKVVVECVALVGSLASEKGITLEADLQPAFVQGDPQRLAEVATNLLTNAIHYNRTQGLVQVSVRSDEGGATLTVADKGMGIAAEDLPHVFERFYRVDPARSRQQGGSGLGLAISKEIVEEHGGRIEVQSVLGEGSTFTVRLVSCLDRYL